MRRLSDTDKAAIHQPTLLCYLVSSLDICQPQEPVRSMLCCTQLKENEDENNEKKEPSHLFSCLCRSAPPIKCATPRLHTTFNINRSWIRNGGGLRVSHEFGFGAIDAEAMITRSKYWINVPERVSCFIRPKSRAG